METKSKITIKDILIAFIAPLSVAIYNVAFLYLNNIGEASLSDTFMPLTISVAIAAVSMAVLVLIAKDAAKSAIIAAILYFVTINYAIFEKAVHKIYPGAKYWHLMPIVVVLFLHAAYFIIKFMSKDIAKTTSNIISFVFIALIAVNVLTNIPEIVSNAMIALKSDENEELQVSEKKKGLRNVYMIILDEYSNFDTIKKYYEYDNKELHDFLVDKGFNISENSKNEKQNFYTLNITTNYLNLDYVAFDSDVDEDVRKKRENPQLFKILNENGYEIHHYDTYYNKVVWNGSNGEGSQGSKSGSQTADGKSFNDVFFSNNIFYIFFLQGNGSGIEQKERINQFEYIKKSFVGQNMSRFVYVHTLGAHAPFVFDENGNRLPLTVNNNWTDRRYYLGQYKYVTKLAIESIDYLIKNDPNAVIILMSDHSARETKNSAGKVIVTAEDRTSILNAVYFGGEIFEDIYGESGVNTLRIILDKLLGTTLGKVKLP